MKLHKYILYIMPLIITYKRIYSMHQIYYYYILKENALKKIFAAVLVRYAEELCGCVPFFCLVGWLDWIERTAFQWDAFNETD